MAYTAADLAAVEAAIMKLVDGQRVVQVKYGDMQTTFSDATRDDLTTLRDQMRAELAGTTGRRRTSVISTSKGL